MLPKTTVSGNAATSVTFTNTTPTINFFRQYNPYNGSYSQVDVDYSGRFVVGGGHVFTWSAVNAQKYEIYAPGGIIYSGTDTSFTMPNNTYVGNDTRNVSFTLRVWNGAKYVDYGINATKNYPDCGGCGSGS